MTVIFFRNNTSDKSITERLLSLIKELIADEQLLDAIIELVIRVSSHPISGAEKKQFVIKSLEDENTKEKMNLFIISRVIDLLVNYLKLVGKINGHKDYTGAKIEKA
jgi:hypothetical protein